MENVLKSIGVIAIILFIGGFISNLFNTPDYIEKTTPSEQVKGTLPVADDTDWEGVYKTNFLNACVDEGAEQSVCSCLHGYVVSNYTWDERMELDRIANEGQTPEALLEAVQYCTGESI